MDQADLIERFKTAPQAAYRVLLEQYTSVMLRMIRKFMKDPDEVMEVYTNICERLCANDYQALRRFQDDGELVPWLSVVVANACRDRYRKNKAASVPRSVLKQLDDRERLVFKYYYQERLPHEDIAEIITRRHRVPYTALEVVRAIGKINDLLSTRKRWMLLSALRANMPTLSIDEMKERVGYQPSTAADLTFDQAMQDEEMMRRLQQALDQLDPDDRMLIHLRFDHNRTAPQIGALMKYDDHRYVYTRLRTVVQQLRRHMGLEE